MSRGVVEKKGTERAVFVYTAKKKKTITIERYLCVRRRKKKPTPTELHLWMRRRKKKTIHIERYLCVRQRKKTPIGCLVGLGNLQGTQLLSGVMGRVGETSIYIRPSLGRGCGRLQPPLQW